MSDTKIEWANKVWNPVTGCTKVSAGCKNCYAERIAQRFWGERKFTDVQSHPERLEQPLHWRKPARIFVDSMSDLFHPSIPDDFIWRVFNIISVNRRHTYMILTKRPERMQAWFEKYQDKFWHYHAPTRPQREFVSAPWPDPCIWLGVSIENQPAADKRIPILLNTPAAVRFVSVEPVLGPVDLREVECSDGDYLGIGLDNLGMGTNLDWVICGCETGPGARPMNLDWARSLRDQCQAAGVPFFLKQARINGKLTKMPELDGQQWLQFPDLLTAH